MRASDLWHRTAAMKRSSQVRSRIAVALAIFTVIAATILTRPQKPLDAFDQPFYLTVAYDLIHHGVFSNGFVDLGNSTGATPPPGMFFGPLYPSLIAAVTRIDARFAKTVDCGAETYRAKRSSTECEVYARPMLLVHALLLTLGVFAVARAAELLFDGRGIFWLTCVVATGALLADANQFAFLMTESATFSLYALAMLAAVLGWTRSQSRYFVMAGFGFGVLCLARLSFLVAAIVIPALIAINTRFVVHPRRERAAAGALAFVLAFLAVIAPWATRNAISVGKFALTEEYGSVALVERFAYDQMTLREFVLSFPYCLPKIGPDIVANAFGPDAMARFQYDLPNSFYFVGAAQRNALTEQFTRIDPIIGEVIRNEMKENWWRYILVSTSLAWCGMWVGGWLGLVLVPLFAIACVAACRRSKPLFLLYSAPAFVMLGLHAVLASFYTRYNLILIGPFSAGAACLISTLAGYVRSQFQIPPPARWFSTARPAGQRE
ncbi:MAG: hypothetical protein ACRET4_19290 [Steroidobacteraceae bacterium]